MGQLKSTLYARMEEVSFRSGAVVAGGVLTAGFMAFEMARCTRIAMLMVPA